MKKVQRIICCAVITIITAFAFVGCSRGNTVENNVTHDAYRFYIEMDDWLAIIKNENLLLFDLSAEGIGVSGNVVVLPSCIPESSITCLNILQMLPYNEFIPSDGIIVDSDKVSENPVLLIELLDITGSRIGLMATHSRIIGLEGKECLTIARTDLVNLWNNINHRDKS